MDSLGTYVDVIGVASDIRVPDSSWAHCKNNVDGELDGRWNQSSQ